MGDHTHNAKGAADTNRVGTVSAATRCWQNNSYKATGDLLADGFLADALQELLHEIEQHSPQTAYECAIDSDELAAHRAGLRQVLLPAGNQKDLRDVPEEVRQHMGFTFVNTMDDVLKLALLPKKPPAPELADQTEATPELPIEAPVFSESRP